MSHTDAMATNLSEPEFAGAVDGFNQLMDFSHQNPPHGMVDLEICWGL